MTLWGLFFLSIDLWRKGYMLMGIAMAASSCVLLTKTMRDRQKASKLVNLIEEAKTKRLLAQLKT